MWPMPPRSLGGMGGSELVVLSGLTGSASVLITVSPSFSVPYHASQSAVCVWQPPYSPCRSIHGGICLPWALCLCCTVAP